MSIPARIILCYFLLVNVATFLLRGMDKWKAVLQKRRISEKMLLLFCALGGWMGGLLAMGAWHHKTVKSAFLVRFYLIVGMWVVVLGVLVKVVFL
jgi:uncharacterized membrane protein YsdA (DUF1294 family)